MPCRPCSVSWRSRSVGRRPRDQRGQVAAGRRLRRRWVRPGEIRQIATHLGSPTAADHAYLLALASGERHRQGLDELHGLISDLLAHPELLGDGADTLAEMRRNQAIALSDEAGARRRLQAAPLSYLSTHEPDELARQARLVEPRPHAGIVRVAVSPNGRVDHWIIDVASRDIDGLLARLSGALTDAGADIVAANVATWPDGAVVDTFVVRSAVRPRARRMAEHMQEALRRRLDRGAVGRHRRDLRRRVAARGTPTSTVSGVDRPGQLSAVAAAFALRRRDRPRRRVSTERRAVQRAVRRHRPPRAQARRRGQGTGAPRARRWSGSPRPVRRTALTHENATEPKHPRRGAETRADLCVAAGGEPCRRVIQAMTTTLRRMHADETGAQVHRRRHDRSRGRHAVHGRSRVRPGRRPRRPRSRPA